jgi:acyl carrier protein
MDSGSEISDLKSRLKKLIVERLKLDIEPESIDSGKPLFGQGGLGLDSIDALELVLGVEQELGVRIDDEDVGSAALASIDALADFIVARRAAST